MRSLFSKLFIGYLFVIVLLSGLIIYFSFETIKSHYIDSFEDDLTNLNYTATDQFTEFLRKKNYDSLNKYVGKLGARIDTRITLIDTTGLVLADSKNDPDDMENHIERPEIQEALKNKVGRSLRYSTTMQDEMLYIAIPIYSEGNIIAISRFSVFLSNINNLTQKLTIDILKVSIIVIVFVLIGIFVFTRKLIKPINQLSAASRKVATGDFEVKVNPKGKDEIFELSKNFNEMTEKLKDLFDQVITQKEEYHILISSIREGMIVLDQEGKILLSNHSFNELFTVDDVKGKHFSEVIKTEKLNQLLQNFLKDRASFTKELEVGENYFLCSGSFIESKNEIVLLFHNISEIKKLEKIKRDFVINVSHELRTPLTAIKGFVETLEEEIDDENERYIQIIRRHTDRLINIVQDLLVLSEVEEENTKLLYSKVDLRSLVENLMHIFEQKISKKNLELKVKIEDDFPKIKMDAFRIEQVLINLIDNAIKYTDEGYIELIIFKEGDHAVIKVCDTGIGISGEDKSRVFERFYIVDKSRSSKVGGTGLGLSIVKHIVLLHKGTIDVESNQNKGTTFIIKLPFDPEIKAEK